MFKWRRHSEICAERKGQVSGAYGEECSGKSSRRQAVLSQISLKHFFSYDDLWLIHLDETLFGQTKIFATAPSFLCVGRWRPPGHSVLKLPALCQCRRLHALNKCGRIVPTFLQGTATAHALKRKPLFYGGPLIAAAHLLDKT